MSSSSKIWTALGVIAAVGVAVWLGFTGGNPPVPPPSTSSAKVNGNETVKTETSAFFSHTKSSKAHATTTPAVEPSSASTNLITDWEDRIEQILRDDSAVGDKAKKMLELLPRLPVAGQVETAQHIANLLADEDYGQFGKYLTNPKTPEDVQEVVLADTLNRPDVIKLPLLLDTARNPENAKAAEAKEILGLYLAGDYGNSWDQWQQAVGTWLKDNPE